jgi:hypothetical protein
MTEDNALKSPLDPHYTGHRDADRRREETREWLKQRERELGMVKDAPSVAPGSIQKDR